MTMRRRAELATGGSARVVVLIAPPGFRCTELLAELSPQPADVVRLTAERAVGALRELGRSTVPSLLVIDDIDQLDPSEQQAVGREVEAAVDGSLNLNVAILSRTRPQLPLGRWQVEEFAEVVMIDRLLLDAPALHAELGLDGAQLELALESTGGWPSAVSLLAQHLKRRSFASALVAARSEHVRFVAEEVLPILSEPERQLLGSLTVLDRLNDTAVTRFTGDDAAPGELRSLAERTQLLGIATAELTWHPDVRAALEQDLERAEPGSRPSRHRAAAAALAHDRSQLSAQLDHLVQADAWDEVLELLAQRWREFVEPDRLDGLVGVVTSMPRDLVAHDVSLSLGAGAILLIWGDAVTATDFFDADCVQSEPAAMATAAALLAHATWWSTAPERALDLAEVAEQFLDGGPDVALVPVLGFETITTGRSMLIVSRARALAMTGQLAEAADLLRFLPLLRREDPVSESVSAWSTKALVDALTGDLISATDAAEMALTLAQAGGWNSTVSIAPAHLARALVAFGSGVCADPWPDVAAATQRAVRARAWGLARVAGAVGALVGSVDRATLDGDVTPPARMPFADRVTVAFRARHALRAGQTDRAAALLGTTEPIELALSPWTEVAVAVHGPDAAASLLDALGPPTTPAGRVDRLVARSHLEPDNTEIAIRAESTASDLGLRGMLRHGAPHVDPAPSASTSEVHQDGAGPVDAIDLSEREWEVLQLLDTPKSLNEVGQDLFVSINTVKWHVRRLYRKLGVHNRVDAVVRARQLGLIGVHDDMENASEME